MSLQEIDISMEKSLPISMYASDPPQMGLAATCSSIRRGINRNKTNRNKRIANLSI